MSDIAAVERARALVGTRFRAQGRNERYGLDCIGLVIRAFALAEDCGRKDYRLRGDYRTALVAGLEPWFRRVPRSRCRPGDVLMFEAGPDQLHLGILSRSGLIHADARLRRVVESPGPPAWPVIAVFRRRVRRPRRGQS